MKSQNSSKKVSIVIWLTYFSLLEPLKTVPLKNKTLPPKKATAKLKPNLEKGMLCEEFNRGLDIRKA